MLYKSQNCKYEIFCKRRDVAAKYSTTSEITTPLGKFVPNPHIKSPLKVL